MKRILTAMMALVALALPARSMSYEQARNEALFLTDKMAYELNLTQEQYDAAYEINLDYLMGVTSVDDVYGTYWERRRLDFSYILLDWQWKAFCAAAYFYRPLYWSGGYWHFGVYARYPRRSYFYFDRPTVFVSYRGGHSWRSHGGRSFYYDHRHHFRPGDNHVGMRDRWDRGDFRGNRNGGNSSTRITVNQRGGTTNRTAGTFGGTKSSGTFSANRNTNTNSGTTSRSAGTFGGAKSSGTFSTNRSSGSNSSATSRSAGTFGGAKSSGTFSTSRPSTTRSTTSGTTRSRSAGTFGGTRSSGTFGTSRSSTTRSTTTRSTPSRSAGTFGGARSSGSFGTSRSSSGSSTRSSATRSAPSRSGGSFGGARSSGSFGGR